MALKDSLKHFNDFDDYSGSLTKADMDNNLDLLADEIDKKANDEDVVFTADDTSIYPKDTHTNKPLSVSSVKFSENSIITHNEIVTDNFKADKNAILGMTRHAIFGHIQKYESRFFRVTALKPLMSIPDITLQRFGQVRPG